MTETITKHLQDSCLWKERAIISKKPYNPHQTKTTNYSRTIKNTIVHDLHIAEQITTKSQISDKTKLTLENYLTKSQIKWAKKWKSYVSTCFSDGNKYNSFRLVSAEYGMKLTIIATLYEWIIMAWTRKVYKLVLIITDELLNYMTHQENETRRR